MNSFLYKVTCRIPFIGLLLHILVLCINYIGSQGVFHASPYILLLFNLLFILFVIVSNVKEKTQNEYLYYAILLLSVWTITKGVLGYFQGRGLSPLVTLSSLSNIFVFGFYFHCIQVFPRILSTISKTVTRFILLSSAILLSVQLWRLFYSSIAGLSYIYYITILLPMVLIFKQDKRQSVLIIIIIFMTIISMKRGGTIGLIAGLVISYFIDILINNRSPKKFIKYIVLIVSVIIILLIGNKISNGLLFERLNTITEEGGDSGRYNIYNDVWEGIKNSDPNSYFLGHGILTTNQATGLSYAHNDFLEIFYDLGLVGVILYCNLLISLFQKGALLIYQRSPYTKSFITSVILFVTLSMLSFVYFIGLFQLFVLSWAIILGLERHRKRAIHNIRHRHYISNRRLIHYKYEDNLHPPSQPLL